MTGWSVLFLWGEEERFAPVGLGRELEKLLPNIPRMYVPAAGHPVQNDQPELVGPPLIEFFSA